MTICQILSELACALSFCRELSVCELASLDGDALSDADQDQAAVPAAQAKSPAEGKKAAAAASSTSPKA